MFSATLMEKNPGLFSSSRVHTHILMHWEIMKLRSYSAIMWPQSSNQRHWSFTCIGCGGRVKVSYLSNTKPPHRSLKWPCGVFRVTFSMCAEQQTVMVTARVQHFLRPTGRKVQSHCCSPLCVSMRRHHLLSCSVTVMFVSKTAVSAHTHTIWQGHKTTRHNHDTIKLFNQNFKFYLFAP